MGVARVQIVGAYNIVTGDCKPVIELIGSGEEPP